MAPIEFQQAIVSCLGRIYVIRSNSFNVRSETWHRSLIERKNPGCNIKFINAVYQKVTFFCIPSWLYILNIFLIKTHPSHNPRELTHFMLLISFDTPWKHQKTKDFLMFSGGIKRDQWHEIQIRIKRDQWHEMG